MKFEAVTSMNESYFQNIGFKMLDSYLINWPDTVKLNLYHEDNYSYITNKKVELKNLYECEPTCKEFVERHQGRPDQQNKLELHKGAVRFSYKTFSIINAATTSTADYLIWIDADTFTHSQITEEFLDELVDPDKYLTYLGRENNYSECGFVIYNLNHPVNQVFMSAWRHLYEQDEVFKLDQWHDSYVFDQIRLTYEQEGIIENINLSPWGKDYDHVFINSILGDYMDHMKGPRKDEGKSRESDLFTKRKSDYWYPQSRFNN